MRQSSIMRLMMLIGFVVTVAVWSNYGPWWGLLSAFLLMGGMGWKLQGHH
jgi:hypothetical protein